MICTPCKDRRHELCRRGTWCDCQHRLPLPPGMTMDQLKERLMEAGRVALQEMETDPPKGHVCSRECNHGRPDL